MCKAQIETTDACMLGRNGPILDDDIRVLPVRRRTHPRIGSLWSLLIQRILRQLDRAPLAAEVCLHEFN